MNDGYQTNVKEGERALRRRIEELGQLRDEYRRMEQRRREIEQLHFNVLESISEGVLVLDREFRHQVWNRAMERISRTPRENVLGSGKRAWELFPHLVEEGIDEMMRAAMRGETVRRDNIPYRLPDGIHGFTSETFMPLRAPDGEIRGVVGVVCDVTEQKAAEEKLRAAQHEMERRVEERTVELRESEERFSKAFQSGPSLMAVSTLSDGRIIEVNRTFLETLGYTRDEVVGRTSAELGLLADPEGRSRFLEEMRRDGISEIPQLKVRDKAGRSHVVRFAAEMIDLQGTACLITNAVDVTETIRTEEARRKTEERLRAALDANPDSVVVYDQDSKVVYCNAAFTRVFGWTLSEVVGRQTSMLVPEELAAEAEGIVDRLHAGDNVSEFKTKRVAKGGTIIPVSVNAALYPGAEGEGAGYVVTVRDMRARRRLESQLLQAQKMEAIGTLAGGVAHDFNNLLQAIRGYAELLLLGTPEGGPGRQELEMIIESSDRGADLTRQLLAFSRKVESHLRPVNFNAEVRRATRLLQRTLPKMIEIRLDLTAAPGVVEADPAQLEQVLLNLAVNARDAMAGEGVLEIGTRRVSFGIDDCRDDPEAEPGEYLELAVSDTGRGMDPGTMQHIFEPFFTTKSMAEGTGLGLAMVYGIVKAHGGHISCSSHPGQGACFRLYFPASSLPAADAESGRIEDHAPGTESVLIIDDDEAVRNLSREVLQRSGYRVTLAADGPQALDALRKGSPGIDLIVLDWIMPGMSGRRCLDAILEIRPGAKVVVASGYTDVDACSGDIPAGARGFLRKPFRMGELLRAVRDVLDDESG